MGHGSHSQRVTRTSAERTEVYFEVYFDAKHRPSVCVFFCRATQHATNSGRGSNSKNNCPTCI